MKYQGNTTNYYTTNVTGVISGFRCEGAENWAFLGY